MFSVSLLGEKIITDLRSQLYAHLIGLDASFHDRNRSNELVSRLATDSELLRSIIGSTMSVATRSTVTAIGSLIMLFITSPRLASLSLVVIPFVILPIFLGAQHLQKAARTSQDRIADTNSFAAETLRALRTVQAYAREHYERTPLRPRTGNEFAGRATTHSHPNMGHRCKHRVDIQCNRRSVMGRCT